MFRRMDTGTNVVKIGDGETEFSSLGIERLHGSELGDLGSTSLLERGSDGMEKMLEGNTVVGNLNLYN